MADGGELLPASVLRQIGAPQYDKRKVAALEVEQTVKRLAKSGDEPRIRRLIDKVGGACTHAWPRGTGPAA